MAAVWVSVGRDKARNLRVGRGGAHPQRSGEAKPTPRGRARWSPWPRGRARRSTPLEAGRDGASPQRSGEAELAHLGVGWSGSRALDYSDVSMSMVISSSFSDTLVLVPDTHILALA